MILSVGDLVPEKAYITYDVKWCLELVNNGVVIGNQLFLNLPNSLLGAWPISSLPPLEVVLGPIPEMALSHLLVLNILI